MNAYNLLNKNNSVVRTVTQTSIQDQTANTLGRYFMLVFNLSISGILHRARLRQICLILVITRFAGRLEMRTGSLQIK